MTAENNTQYLVDPVCQIKVTNNSKVPPYTVHSNTYYFCTGACREAFIADPDKYLMATHAKRKGLWARYLDRLNKATGGKPPCCH